MDTLDGMLMVPPDRSQILGRALWKLRYVVVGRRSAVGSQKDHQSSPSYSQLVTSSRNNPGSRALPRLPTEESCLIVFKHKDDSEPVQQWPINSIIDCQVQMISHRKQGPVLPTLVVTISDKERKRRSSRAAGLMSSGKDSTATTIWFRTPPDDHYPSLHEWARFILSKKMPMSPDSPISPQFSNPFSPISRDPADYFPRPSSGNQSNRSEGRGLQHKTSNHAYSASTRERPLTFSSESTSLRSKRSDVSSPSISNYTGHSMNYPIPGQHYTTVLPTDLPSPITTAGEYQGEFIEGWTSAQGRSSTMSSPIRGRESIGSHAHQSSMAVTDSSSPPGPRETILDRAFQLRCIPGSENEIPGEEKLSSMARFEALMRDADDKRRQREAAERAQQMAIRSAFEASESSPEEKNSDDTDDDNFADEHERRTPPLIPRTTQRALQFIASRHESLHSSNTTRPTMSRNPSSFQTDFQTHLIQAPPIRPHTAHARSRLNGNQRSYSTPQLTPSMASMEITSTADQGSDDGTIQGNAEKRQSSTSTKRLSFSEFTKRLSSTSSLLLVQTNTSGGSSRRSSEVDVQSSAVSRTTLIPRGPGPTPTRERDRDDYDRRCGWRGSVGVLGNDGGLL